MKEYATTIGTVHPYESYAEPPCPPIGKYWRMIGSTSVVNRDRTDTLSVVVMWFWERDVI